MLEPSSDLTSDELWIFYSEVAASGEVGILSKPVFLRRLTPVMDVVFGVRKCHSVLRDSRCLRGFRGVGIRMEPCDTTGWGHSVAHQIL